MTRTTAGPVEWIVRGLLLLLLAGVWVGAIWLWSRAHRAFGVFGSVTLGLALTVMSVHLLRAVQGRFLLPSFIVVILAAIPAVVVARMQDAGWFWFYVSHGTTLLAVVMGVLLVLGLVFRRRPGPALTVLLLGGAMALVHLSSANFDRILTIQSDLKIMVQEREELQRQVAEAERVKQERLAETGGPMAITMSEDEAADEGGMSTAEREAYREKLAKAREARRKLQSEQEQRTKEGPDYGDLGAQYAREEETGGVVYQDLDEQLNQQMVARAAEVWTPDEKAKAADYADYLSIFSKYLLVVSVLLAVVGYLHQLTRTACACYPLPITGRWLADLSPTEHVVWFDVDDGRSLPAFLRTAVAKGESFIFCGPTYPLRAERLPRWQICGLGLPTLGLDGLKEVLWQDHLRDDEAEFFANAAFVFESAWHGRVSFSVQNLQVAEHLLRAMAGFADTRRETRATVGRTLNLLWAFAEPPPAEAFDTLATLAHRENLRLIVVGPETPPPFIDRRIEAIFDQQDLL